MPELKQTFQQAKMNQDMDERLVPNGQYRSATNIEIATSDGSNVGTVQTVLSTHRRDQLSNPTIDMANDYNIYADSSGGYSSYLHTVGCVADPANDKIYYLVAGGQGSAYGSYVATRKDFIVEYDTVNETNKYVFVDIWGVDTTVSGAPPTTSTFYVAAGAGSSTNTTGLRVGMTLTTTAITPNLTPSDAVTIVDLDYITAGSVNKWRVTTNAAHGLSDTHTVTFESPRTLNFNQEVLITGVSILEGFLYWTDNNTEPKKINIKRCIAGTGGTVELNTNPSDTFLGNTSYFHTRLVKSSSDYTELEDAFNVDYVNDSIYGNLPTYMDESHVTVIKKAPTQPLDLQMYRTNLDRVNSNGDSNTTEATSPVNSFFPSFQGVFDWNNVFYPDAENITFSNPVDYRVGDILLLTLDQNSDLDLPEAEYFDLRVRVVSSPVNDPNNLAAGPFTIELLSNSADGGLFLSDYQGDFGVQDVHAKLHKKDVLFQHKFPRFSYRYKYEDGEYSPFAPWSQVAFLPDFFEYKPKKGYNFGMSNQLRGLKLTHYVANENALPKDVAAIDLLYKEAGKAAVYTVKTIKPNGLDPEWPDQTNGLNDQRGEYTITTDMVHAVVPSNQILRPYDNVPRKALAQEVSANRIIYGNYLQGYNVLQDPVINAGFESTGLGSLSSSYAYPSVKTIRKYQVGVVYSDKYGRETPVLTTRDSAFEIPITYSTNRNRLQARIDHLQTVVPDWAEYFSYYVKETSVEYYTMSNDRWYDAADGNIWLAFPSADRNKIMEDDYIILKKAMGSDNAVKINNRYKVLAIENEAPDFIKTKKKILGTLSAQLGDVGNADTGENYPIPGVISIEINDSQFISAFGSNLHIRTPDTLKVIFWGAGTYSREYEISRLTRIGVSDEFEEGEGNFKLTFTEPLGEDVAFTSTTASALNAIPDLRIQLLEAEVENTPQFDGKFFVKVYKDALLEENVLLLRTTSYTPGDSWQVAYINNNGYSDYDVNTVNPFKLPQFNYINDGSVNWQVDGDGNQLKGSIPTHASNDLSDENRSRHPTEWGYNAGGSGEVGSGDTIVDGVYYWANNSFASSSQSNMYGLTANAINTNPQGAINNENGNDGTGSNAKKYWQGIADEKVFFIDHCTAYSWDGVNRPGQIGVVQDSWAGSTGDAWGQPDCCPPYNSGEPLVANMHGVNPPVYGSFGTNTNTGRVGIPSKGIWGTGNGSSFIDISWVNFGRNRHTGGQPPDGGYCHRIQDSENVEAWNFISQLVTPGARFRFGRDPDATVYTVQGTFGGDDPGGGSTGNLKYSNPEIYTAHATTHFTGAWGIRNVNHGSSNSNEKKQFGKGQMRQRWTIKVTPEIGDPWSSPGFGYSPVRGTLPQEYGGPALTDAAFRRALPHDGSGKDVIQLLQPISVLGSNDGNFSENPAIWETEPRESVDLDIYYQASGLIPTTLNKRTREELIPIGSTFTLPAVNEFESTTHTVTGWNQTGTVNKILFTPAIPSGYVFTEDQSIMFTKRGNYSFTVNANITAGALANAATTMLLHGDSSTNDWAHKLPFQTHYLDWNNCWCFGNGVESDRARDAFNAAQMDNGVKASASIAEPVVEERRKHGMIWSGIYNSNAKINDTNQFIMAESITKDLNPVYGSLQALLNRETRLVMFCEDKILRGVTNKDALYNADGNPQLVASNAVIGDVTPYAGKFGISKNPESIATTPSTTYFTDVARGAVLALSNSGDGIRPISDIGMKDYFGDYMASHMWRAIGTYDSRKNEYNISLQKKYETWQNEPHEKVTVAYSEKSKGWISFRSFYPETGISLNNKYYTFKSGYIWEHHYDLGDDVEYKVNRFHGSSSSSSITFLFNGMPETVKTFSTINYEGTKPYIPQFDNVDNNNYFTGDYSVNAGVVDTDDVTDGEYYNIFSKILGPNNSKGWYVTGLETNLQTCGELYFKNKENKYFAYPTGESTSLTNLDTSEFSVQGLGFAQVTHGDNTAAVKRTLTFANNTDSSRNMGPGGTLDSAGTATQIGTNRWTVHSDSIELNDSSAIGGGQMVSLRITPFYTQSEGGNSVYTGFPLTAANFKIDGATEDSSTEYTVDANTGVITVNASTGAVGSFSATNSAVASVEFEDDGTAGDPTNEVLVSVYLNSSFTPNNDSTTYLDIDEVVPITAPRKRSACLLVQYDNLDNASETLNAVSGITTANVLNLPHVINKHSGDVDDNTTSLLAHYTFATTGTTYYAGGNLTPHISFEGLGDYEPYYSSEVNFTYNVSNQITGIDVKIYYTPPTVGSLASDPPNMCLLGHKAIIRYATKTPDSHQTKYDIAGISYDSNLGALGGTRAIVVSGKKDSRYRLFVNKKQSLTSDVNHATEGYYNFSTFKFQAGEACAVGTFPASGKVTTYVNFPNSEADTRYDIVIDGAVDGGYSLSPSIPTLPGQAKIIQKGVRTLTLKPITTTASNFGTLPELEIKRPYNLSNPRRTPYAVDEISMLASTKNKASTRLRLDNENFDIVKDMYVYSPGDNTAIPFGTKVVSIDKTVITLSNEVTLPKNTRVSFLSNNPSVHTFSMTVPAGSGKRLQLKETKDVNMHKAIGGLSSQAFTISYAISVGDVIRPTGTSDEFFSILKRMTVGSSVTSSLGNITNRTVESINMVAGTFTVTSGDSTIEELLSPGGTLGVDSVAQLFVGDADTENTNIKPIHTQAIIDDGALKVEGYLELPSIEFTKEAYILIDDMVHVS